MGIKFRCQACDKKLHVKSFLAGKRGVCPKCGAKVQIPLVSEDEAGSVGAAAAGQGVTAPASRRSAPPATDAPGGAMAGAGPGRDPTQPAGPVPDAGGSPAGPDPIAEAPGAVWYVRPPTGGQFGPADATIMRRWLEEGRVGSDALVWREGWAEWSLARTVFPSLDELTAVPIEPGAAAADESSGEQAIVVSEPNRAVGRRGTALSSRRHTRNVVVVVALAVLCLVLGVILFLVLRHTS